MLPLVVLLGTIGTCHIYEEECSDFLSGSVLYMCVFAGSFVLKCIYYIHKGKDPATKSDEFFEQFQTAFDPPPLIFGKLYCKFFITTMVAFREDIN